MKLNLRYYNGEDKYSDGDIENDIIKYIEKINIDEYETIFETDMRWPVYYHLSPIRQNILSWYPFEKDKTVLEIGAGMGAITEILIQKTKSVTSVELSKKRATAIQKRCKNAKNLEIIVGNFNDIKFNEKYDYITLIGVLEYAPSFTNTSNPMYDFLCKIKSLLKPNGKILIAIENRMGLKYLCGADEDHTGIPYSGINGYYGINNVKTLDKTEMEELIKSLNMKCNFYYPFPDYKFPEIIITDKFVSNSYDLMYTPYYSSYGYLSMGEDTLLNNINRLNALDKFANSFFIEVSNEKMSNDIELVKFQNIRRKDEYQLATIVRDKCIIKYSLCNKATQFLNEVYRNHEDFKNNNNNYYGKISGDKLVFNKLKYTKLVDIIFRDKETFNQYFDKLIKKINTSSKVECSDNNIFNEFNIKVEKKDLEKMTFLKRGYLDLTFFNAFIDDKENLIFIDQEWAYDYVPVEYIIYRNLNLIPICDKNNIIDVDELYKKYKINKNIFEKLEKQFTKTIFNNYKNQFYNNYKITDVKGIEISYKNLLKSCEELEIEKNSILESKIVLDSEKADILKKYAELEVVNEKLNETNKRLNETNKRLNEDNSKLIKENKNRISELENTNETLQGIYNSKTWKTIDKIKRIFKIFRK